MRQGDQSKTSSYFLKKAYFEVKESGLQFSFSMFP